MNAKIRKKHSLILVFVLLVFISVQVVLGEEIFFSDEFHYKAPVEIAILPFINDTTDDKFGWISGNIMGSLTAKFTSPRAISVIRLMEIKLLKDVVELLGLSSSDWATNKNALKQGKLIPAKIMICGSYHKDSKDEINIIAKFTDVETGTVMLTKKTRGRTKKIDDVIERFSQELLLFIEESSTHNTKLNFNVEGRDTNTKGHNINAIVSKKKKSKGNWASTSPLFIAYLVCLIMIYKGNHAS